MRPSTRTGQSPPTAGYGRFVGRVGALALFLGVGTALSMPVASAEGDDSSRSGSASSPAASSASDSARGPSSRPARATRGAAQRVAAAPQSLSASPRGASITSSAEGDPQAPVASSVSSAAAASTRRTAGVTPRRQFAVGAAASVSAVSTPQAELSNQVSPLGTPVQIAREQIAMRTAASLPVTLMKFVLRQGFLAAGNQQFALVGGLDEANLQALDDAVDEYALASAFSHPGS